MSAVQVLTRFGLTRTSPEAPVFTDPPDDITVTDTSEYDGAAIALEDGSDILLIFKRGSGHAIDTDTFKIASDDGAQTYGTEGAVIGDSNDYRATTGGILANGDIVMVTHKYDSGGTSQGLFPLLRTSGAWSVGATEITTFDTTTVPYGRVLEMPDGALLQGFYGVTSGTYRLYVMESNDNGATWGDKVELAVSGTSSFQPNEGAFLLVDGATRAASRILCVTRNQEGPMKQFKSTDGGATWTDMGFLPFSVDESGSNDIDASPDLFLLQDDRIVLMWADRQFDQLKFVVADKDDVLASVDDWGDVRSAYAGTNPSGSNWGGYPSIFRAGEDDDTIGVVFYQEQDAARTDANLLQRALDVADLTTLFYDSFTDTDGTLLENHTPDTDTQGGGWVHAHAGTASITSNAVTIEDAGARYVANVGTAVALARIESVTMIGATGVLELFARHDGDLDIDNCWQLMFIDDTNELRLVERNGGTGTTRASETISDPSSIEIRAYADRVEGWTDGVQRLSYASTVHNANTRVGFGHGSTTDGVTVDDFRVKAL